MLEQIQPGVAKYADLSSPGSIPARVADDTNGRSDCEAIRCARIAPGTRCLVQAAVRATDDLAQYRRARVRPLADGRHRRVAPGVRNLCGRTLASQPVPIHAPQELSDRGLQIRMPLRCVRGACKAPSAGRNVCCSISFRAGSARNCFRSRPGAFAAGQAVPRRRGGPDPIRRSGGASLAAHGDANHLAAPRHVADPARIVIVSGVQEGLAIAARCSWPAVSLGVVEDPCYQGAASASKLREPKLQVWPSTARLDRGSIA